MSEIDKQQLYGAYLAREEWRDRLDRKLAHKSLDIPDLEDDLNVTNTHTKSGLSTAGLAAVLAAMLTSGGLGAGAMLLANRPLPPAVERPSEPEHIDRGFDWELWTEENK